MMPSETGTAGNPMAEAGCPPAGLLLRAAVDGIVKEFGADRSRLLDIVQTVQHRFGRLSDEAIRAVAAGLGIHAVEVEDKVSFYAFLNREPKGRFHIRLSKTPVSLIKGASEVAEAFSKAAGVSIGATSADGEFTVECTSDIGMADQEPSALINGTVVTALTPADPPAIIAALRQGRIVNTLPLFPGLDSHGAGLPQARVASSLV